eukprot:TRINITY_DN95811_c0_g1_i1.p1 TRINITY_DN95811_c0_g1~~TRINITY_DN95811_c0_g1_i1.p1  ORF type:complete len:871 (+),score=132.57 TRINITY_DN95811_c0_g1_i1:112-2724(+)
MRKSFLCLATTALIYWNEIIICSCSNKEEDAAECDEEDDYHEVSLLQTFHQPLTLKSSIHSNEPSRAKAPHQKTLAVALSALPAVAEVWKALTSAKTWNVVSVYWWAGPSVWLALFTCASVVQIWILLRGQAQFPQAGPSEALLDSDEGRCASGEASGIFEDSPSVFGYKAPGESATFEVYSAFQDSFQDNWLQQVEKNGAKDASLKSALMYQGWNELRVWSMLIRLLSFVTNLILPAVGLRLLLDRLRNLRSDQTAINSASDGFLVLIFCAVVPLFGSFLEQILRERDGKVAAQTLVSLVGMISKKASHLPPMEVGDGMCFQSFGGAAGVLDAAEAVSEALPAAWTAIQHLLQVAALQACLFWLMGPPALFASFGFSILHLIISGRSRSLVPHFMSYEVAWRRRQELLKPPCGTDASITEELWQLREQELLGVRSIYAIGGQLASVAAAWPRLLTIVSVTGASVFSQWRHRQDHLIFPSLFLLHGLIRQIAALSNALMKTFAAQPMLSRLDSFLKLEEVANARTAEIIHQSGAGSSTLQSRSCKDLVDVDSTTTRCEIQKTSGTSVNACFSVFTLGGFARAFPVVALLVLSQGAAIVSDWTLVDNFAEIVSSARWGAATPSASFLLVSFVLSAIASIACAGAACAAVEELRRKLSETLPLSMQSCFTDDLKKVDLGLSRNIWGLFAALSTICCSCAYIHRQLPFPVLGFTLLTPTYVAAAAFICTSSKVCPKLFQRYLEQKNKTVERFQEFAETQRIENLAKLAEWRFLASVAPSQWLSWRLAVCFSSVYTMTALLLLSSTETSPYEAQRPGIIESGFTLMLCSLMIQSLTSTIDIILRGGEAEQLAAGRLQAHLQQIERVDGSKGYSC